MTQIGDERLRVEVRKNFRTNEIYFKGVFRDEEPLTRMAFLTICKKKSALANIVFVLRVPLHIRISIVPFLRENILVKLTAQYLSPANLWNSVFEVISPVNLFRSMQ